jgi:hypothetical protein
MVATNAHMDVLDKLATVGDGDAPLQDARHGALVQLAVDCSERSGHPGDASGFGPIREKFLSINSSEVFGPPILCMGGGSVSSSKESTNASFEGSSSMGSTPAGFEGAPKGSSWLEGGDPRSIDGFVTSHVKTFGGNGDSPRRNLREFVRLLIVLAMDVIELDAVKFVHEGTHDIVVCFHLFVLTAHILHNLVNYEMRVPPDVEALVACFDGDSKAAEEGLVLRHVVEHGEMQAHLVPHVLPEG